MERLPLHLTLDLAWTTMVPNPDRRARISTPEVSLLDALAVNTEDLDLSVRPHNILDATGNSRVYKMVQLGPKNFPPGFGAQTQSGTGAILGEFGLGYGMTFEPELIAAIEELIASTMVQAVEMTSQAIAALDAELLAKRAEYEAAIQNIDARRAALGTVSLDDLPNPLPHYAQLAYDRQIKRRQGR